MSVAPNPSEIFTRAVEEGERRLDQSMFELVATSFIAGFTIVFGVAALGMVHAAFTPAFPEIAPVAASLAFAIGVVFLVVGRAELFNENFFDPVAKSVDRSDSWMVGPLLRLWSVTFVVNLIGGGLFATVFAVEGVLPSGSASALSNLAEAIVHRPALTMFAAAVVGGALVSLLSFLLESVNSVGSRLSMSFVVGFLLALGAFDHVVVSVIHVFFGILFGAPVGYYDLAFVAVVTTAGNLVGGLGLVTVTHVAQAVGAEESSEGDG